MRYYKTDRGEISLTSNILHVDMVNDFNTLGNVDQRLVGNVELGQRSDILIVDVTIFFYRICRAKGNGIDSNWNHQKRTCGSYRYELRHVMLQNARGKRFSF